MNKIIKTITATVATALSSFGLSLPAYADSVCDQPVSDEVKAAAGCPGTNVANAQDLVTNILNAVIGALGLVCVIVIIIGGVNYMTSAGDAGKLKKARETILYAVIGLIICVLAFAIVNFAIRTVNNASTAAFPMIIALIS